MRATRRALAITAAPGRCCSRERRGRRRRADGGRSEARGRRRSPRAWPAGADGVHRRRRRSSSSRRRAARSSGSGRRRAAAVVLDLTVNSNSERGLLGIALDKYFTPQRARLPVLERDDARRRQQRRRRRAADGQPARPLQVGRQHADVSTRRCTAAARYQDDATNRTTRPCRSSAATTTAASCASARTARSTCRSATPAAAARRRTCSTARSATGIPDDQFGGPDTTNDHLTGVILRLNHGRHGAARQPVLEGRRRARRPGRREPQEDLRLRPAQRFRHGVRPVQRRPVGAGERRRLLHEINRAQAGFNSGWTQVMGPLDARRPVQGDRDHPRPEPARPASARRLLRPPADPLGLRRTSPTPRGRPTTACSSSPARSSPTRR